MGIETRIAASLAIITIDNPPVNAASYDVRAGLMDALKSLETEPEVRGVVLICAGRTFVAGADIREFNQPVRDPHLSDLVRAIERASKPWVAAIHGTALGGGLELAMACHGRVADIKAKLGLPEVNLGLIPGAGGTVRLPRLVAADVALDIITSGKPISAAQAYQEGLVDEIVACDSSDDLLKAAQNHATRLALRAQSERILSTLDRPVHQPTSEAEFQDKLKRLVAKSRGQLSVVEAGHAVQRTLAMDAEAALRAERATFQTLKESEQSQALRYVFFAERNTLSDLRCKQEPRPFDRIGIVGGGTMGCGIAVACLIAGLRVTLIEIKANALTEIQDRIAADLAQAVQRGKISSEQFLDCKANFSCTADMANLKPVHLVIEAAFEDLRVKTQIFRELDAITAPEAILATNTSYLDVNKIAAAVSHSERVLGLHFFSPAHIMKLLEIVVPDQVADDCIATAAALAKRLGKTTVLAGVCDGFIGNRIMATYRFEAECLLEEGAMPEDVDRAMTEFGFPMGVFAMQDLAGLDIAWAMRKRRNEQAPNAGSKRYVEIADKLCEAGRFGRKAGRGWYLYPDAASKGAPDSEVAELIHAARVRKQISAVQFSDDEIMSRILAAMQQEAQSVLSEGVAQQGSDIDVVMVHGYSFPRWRGGPLYMMQAGTRS